MTHIYIYIEAALSSWMVVTPCLTEKPHPDWISVTEPSVYTMGSCSLLFSWLTSFISESILPAGHSQQCFAMLSGRSIPKRCTLTLVLLPVGRRLEYFHLGVFLSVFLAWHCYLWICEYSYLGVVTCGYDSTPTLASRSWSFSAQPAAAGAEGRGWTREVTSLPA